MRNHNAFFLTFCLSLTAALFFAYSQFVAHFNDKEVYETKISQLQKEIQKERLNSTLLSYQLKDFQQTVAQVLPQGEKLRAQYNLRNLASVVRSPASVSSVELSGVVYEKAKRFFSDKNYDGAIKTFHQMVQQYPLSPYSVEARFFIAESYFLKRDFRSSLLEIEHMVTQYPEHDLTGFILLRMGQISEFNNQSEEASEIYRTVFEKFRNPDLKKQAQKLSQGVNF